MSQLNLVHYLEAVRLELGGVVRAVLDMAQVMSDAGHRVHLLTPDALDVPKPWMQGEAGQPKVSVVPPVKFGRRISAEADRAVREADVLHLHGPWCTGNLALANMAQRIGKPYILTLHGMLDDWSMQQKRLKKRTYLTLFGQRVLERAASIQCTAEAERKQSHPWYPKGRPIIQPYIIDTEPYQQLPGPEEAREKFTRLQEDRFNVLFLSRIHPKKGVEHLIDAAPLLVQRGVQANIFITGPEEIAYQAELTDRIRRHGVEDSVMFTGPVYGQTKTSLYQAADVFVLPTSQENFGLVLTEAMSCGTPVITTRGTDIWSEVESAGGIIVEQEAQAIAGAIQDLAKDRDHCRALGERGRQWVLERFDRKRLIQEYEAMYRKAQSSHS